MKDKYIVWDSSTPSVFFAHFNGQESLQLLKHYRRGTLGTAFPDFFKDLTPHLSFDSSYEVIMGAGPGSFTGIKTGLTFMLSYLYAKGISRINTISSLDLFSLYIPYVEDALVFVLQPFNQRELFITVYKWENGKRVYLERDCFIDYGQLQKIVERINYDRVILFSVEKLQQHVEDLFSRYCMSIVTYSPGGDFYQSHFNEIPVINTLDITKDPMILNYVTAPAKLKGAQSDFYLTLQ